MSSAYKDMWCFVPFDNHLRDLNGFHRWFKDITSLIYWNIVWLGWIKSVIPTRRSQTLSQCLETKLLATGLIWACITRVNSDRTGLCGKLHIMQTVMIGLANSLTSDFHTEIGWKLDISNDPFHSLETKFKATFQSI